VWTGIYVFGNEAENEDEPHRHIRPNRRED
jgi:hypothetical protein